MRQIKNIKINYRRTIIVSSLCLLLIISFLLIKNKMPYGDENPHLEQTILFMKGEYKLLTGFAKLPGYPAALAFLGSLININQIEGLRTISFLFAVSSIIIFYKLTRKIDPQNSLIKTFQYAFMPIQFIYLFLLYTESLSHLLILSMFYLAINKKYFYAGLVSFLSITVRQTNVIWMVMIFCYIYLKLKGSSLSLAKIFRVLRKTFLFSIVFILFAVFIYFNKGVAVEDAAATPSFEIHLGNIYWFLFLFFTIYLPLNFLNFSKNMSTIKTNYLVIFQAVIFFIFSLTFFYYYHPMNTDPEHLQNRFLVFFNSGLLPKIILTLIAIYSIISLSTVKLIKKEYYLIYPFSFMVLIPFWLISERYSILPLVLFNLVRKKEATKIEILITIYFLILSLLFLEAYLSRRYLL